MRRTASLGSALLVLASGLGCGDTAVAPADEYDWTPILSAFAHDVVLPTYADLEVNAILLRAASNDLRATPNLTTLAAARAAWLATRAPWEQSEGFLFGPVDYRGYDPALDSWPVSQIDLDAVLASGRSLSPDFVRSLDNTLKGFHTIEYLLFGADGTKHPEDFTVRELDYLVATCALLEESTASLHGSWAPTGGNFAGEIANAGKGSSTYASAEAAVQSIVNGMIDICDEVANGKINEPFANQDARLEESRFSDNSINDFQNNLRSVRNVFRGGYRSDGDGLDDFLASRDAALSARLAQEIDAAIAVIGAIPYPFRTAMSLHPAEILAAQAAIRRLQTSLQQDVLPLVTGGGS